VIYHDNYYKAQDDIPFEERVKQNYDHPDAIETDLLVRQLDQLMQGQTIESPVYDYTIHTRSKETVAVAPRPVILLEGILVLSDVRLRERMDIKIYVEADADERILRRVMRDVNERGRDLEGIVNQYLNTVKPMHYIYVEPTRAMADIVINSGMNDVAYDIVCSKIRSILSESQTLQDGKTARKMGKDPIFLFSCFILRGCWRSPCRCSTKAQSAVRRKAVLPPSGSRC
jgi:uridine kinase